jgi:hypothetical protein
MATGPKVAKAMVNVLAQVTTSSQIETFKDFKSEALEIYSYVARCNDTNAKVASVEKQAPVIPTGAKNRYIAPVADAISKEPPARQADAVLKLLAIQVVGRVAKSQHADGCLSIIATAQKKMTNYMGEETANAQYVKMLLPNNQEAAEAFEVCKQAHIVQPMMATLNRYYRAAKHADLPGLRSASPQSFVSYAKGAFKSWHRLLHSNLGELCYMQAPYEDKENYFRSAKYWSARHKRHYGHNAEHARLSKAGGHSVKAGTVAELLSYELKAKVMDKMAEMALAGVVQEDALEAAKEVVHNVYSRATAKRLNRSYDTIEEMVQALSQGEHLVTAHAIEMSLSKAAVTIEMVSHDLYLSVRRPRPNRMVQEVSRIVGEHPCSGHDRGWAESGERTTKDWVKLYKVKSAFGSSLEPIIDYAYVGRDADTVSAPFSAQHSETITLKSRSKVRYTSISSQPSGQSVATSQHSRRHYGNETMPGRRHGVSTLPDPSDMRLLLATQRSAELSPLTVPSALEAEPVSQLSPPPIQDVDLAASNLTNDTQETDTAQPALAPRPELAVSKRALRAQLKRANVKNLANAQDWTDL